MRFLNPKVHGFLDYAAVVLFFAAPSLFGFIGTPPATLSYVLGAVHLVLSLMTAYPLGVIRAIPFPVHGAIEFMMALALVAFPWILGFADNVNARNFFAAGGIGLFLVWSITNYRATLSAEVRRDLDRPEKEEYRKAA